MWNPLSPAQVVAAIGPPVRGAARSDAPLGAWESGQLLSVYSATRHLAAEMTTVEPAVPEVALDLADLVEDALPALAAQLRVVRDPRMLGELACEVLDVLAARCTTRDAVHARLAAAVRLEVAALADAIEEPAA